MLPLLKNLRIDSSPAVELVPERCLRRRLNTCECRLCLDACPSGALVFVGRQPQLDPQKCTTCMGCTAVCPNDALVADCDLEEVLRAISARTVEEVVISCTRKKQLSVAEIAVPCQGIFTGEALLALGMSGCPSVVFNLGGCSACENRQAAGLFVAAWQRVQHIAADILRTELTVTENLELVAGGQPPDRRSFLGSLRTSLATMVQDRQEFSSALRPKTSGRRIPVRVKIIDQVIATAPAESRPHLLDLCTPRLTVGPECNCCPRCTGICPTGAIRTSGSGAEKQLLFTASLCSGCGLCVSFCQRKALSLSIAPLSGQGSAGIPAHL